MQRPGLERSQEACGVWAGLRRDWKEVGGVLCLDGATEGQGEVGKEVGVD